MYGKASRQLGWLYRNKYAPDPEPPLEPLSPDRIRDAQQRLAEYDRKRVIYEPVEQFENDPNFPACIVGKQIMVRNIRGCVTTVSVSASGGLFYTLVTPSGGKHTFPATHR